MAQTTTRQRTRTARSSRPVCKTRMRRLPWGWLGLGSLLAVAAVVVAVLSLSGGRDGSGGEPISALRTSDFHALAFSSDDPNVVFFGHHNGIMRSDDGGRSWRPLVERRNFDAMNLAVDLANPRRVYLAGHDIFQVSNNGGASWQPGRHNLPGTDIHGFAMSPDDPNRLYAFVVGQGLFASPDGGQHWQRRDGRLPEDVMALATAGGDPETLYVGSMRAGVLKSTDGGQNWAPAVNGLGSRNVMSLAVVPTAPQTVYAGLEGSLYKSTDGGASWRRLPFPGDNVAAVAVSRANPNLVLAIAMKDRQGLVYRSADGGMTWGGR